MGHTVYRHDTLPSPLRDLTERYVTIPTQEVLRVEKQDFRIIYFLESGLEILFPDGYRQRIERGDAVSISNSSNLQYKAIRESETVKSHVLVITVDEELLTQHKTYKKHLETDETTRFYMELRDQLSGFHHFPNALGHGNGWEILSLIRRENGVNVKSSKWKISALALALISGLLAPSGAPKKTSNRMATRSSTAVERACHYMRDHLQSKLALNKIAWDVQLSGEHLERLFQKHLGCTVFDYLQNIRIDKVKELLLTTDQTVTQIAVQSGYSSPSLLGRHFKRWTGMTPLAYRLQGRKEESYSPSTFNVGAKKHAKR